MENNNKAVVNVYIILGEANMKKSSTMRCLSGVDREKVYKIQHANGNIRNTFVKISAIQEANFTETEFTTHVAAKQYEDIFICLRINGFIHPKSQRPLKSAVDYINHFRSIGWNVIKIVDFQDSNSIISLGNITPTLTIMNTKQKTANNIASTVRNYFNWI